MKGLLPIGHRLAMLVILLLGLALGLYRLDLQAALGDDAFSLNIANQELGRLLWLAAHEPHPPIFYLLLWGWVRLAGDSEFSGRFVAVWWGVLAIAIIYRLGRQLAGRRTGLLGAFLLSINPFFVNYIQQARMYSMMVALSMASVWFFAGLGSEQAGDRPVESFRRWLPLWLAYYFTTLLAVATHFFAFFIVALQNVVWLAMNRRRPWRLRPWLIVQGALLLCYLPWVLVAYPTLATYTNPMVRQAGLNQVFFRTLGTFVLGEDPNPAEPFLMAGAIALLLAGLWRAYRHKPLFPVEAGRAADLAWLIPAYLFGPMILVYLVSLVRPMFFERYMMVVLPAYLLLLAFGLDTLSYRSGWLLPLGLLLPITAGLLTLPDHYATVKYATAADMRAMIGFIAAHARSNAVVISNLPPSDPTYAYYYRGPWPLVYLPEDEAPQAIQEKLAALAANHSEVWYLPYSAERAIVEPWLDAHGVRVSHKWYGHAQLVRYAFPPAPPAAPTVPLTDRFAEGIRLIGYHLATPEVEAGQPILITLYWQAEGKIPKRYKVFVHLLDAQGQLRGQQDTEPRNGLLPTDAWPSGEVIADTYGVAVPLGAPSGRYRLVAGWYDGSTGARLKVSGGQDRVDLGEILVR